MPRPSSKKSKSPRRASKSEASSEKGAEIRLQKLLAAAGFGSRRQCEELIIEGRVEVNGKIVDQLGSTFDPKEAKVFVDGTALRAQKLVYYAVNKPVGVVTTNSDPQGRPRVIDMVPPTERVFPVGRLDRSSEGLILLTNDGELAQKLAHPKYQIKKVYRVVVAGKVDVKAMKQMEKGIYIAEGFVRVEGAKIIKAKGKATELEVTLREGKNREIRRIFARLGHKVQQLRRIAVGPLRLGEVPIGAYRVLGRDEVKKLRVAAEESIKLGAAEGGRPRSKTAIAKNKTEKYRADSGKSTGSKTSGSREAGPKPVGSRRSSESRSGSVKKGGVKKGGVRIERSPSYEPPPKSGVIIGGEESETKPAKRKKTSTKRAKPAGRTPARGGTKRSSSRPASGSRSASGGRSGSGSRTTKKPARGAGKPGAPVSRNRNVKKKRRP
ncbi:pseudouridine synthase [Novipirellula rosea]|uniref:Pseudouridine synthase n=1 Tax=Novipirellula rosea TaxID=1031540 RepID=A0ABP8NJF9_9BACT